MGGGHFVGIVKGRCISKRLRTQVPEDIAILQDLTFKREYCKSLCVFRE